MNREAIYSALFVRLQTVVGFAQVKRRLKHWSDVSAADQPALFITQGDETADIQTMQPTKWLLHCDLYLYAHTGGDDTISPSSILNPLIDAVTSLFDPNPIKNRRTLGGLVEYVRVDGSIETDEGLLGDQAIAIIPIVMLAT